jgi:hypothetical protein
MQSVNPFAPKKSFDPMTIVGFLLPIVFAMLIGFAIRAHSRPIQSPLAQNTNPSGGVTSTAPVNPPSSDEVAAADNAILSYCRNDLRQDTSCGLIANSNKTAPGFVESGVQMSGHFAADGSSAEGLALAKGSGSTWSVIWVGQNCLPQDIANQYAVPDTLSVCSS